MSANQRKFAKRSMKFGWNEPETEVNRVKRESLMTKIGNFLVKFDNTCDYLPIVSTATNLLDLFQKTIVLPRFTAEEIESSHYYAHLQKKKISRCLMLLLPLIGNFIVAIQDFRNQPGMKSYLANVQKEIQISRKSFEKQAKLVSVQF